MVAQTQAHTPCDFLGELNWSVFGILCTFSIVSIGFIFWDIWARPWFTWSMVFAAVGISESYFLCLSVSQVLNAIFHWKCREATWLVLWTVPLQTPMKIDFNHLISSTFLFRLNTPFCGESTRCRWPRPCQAWWRSPRYAENNRQPGQCAPSARETVRSRTAFPQMRGEAPGSSAGLRASAWPPEGRSHVMLIFCKLNLHYQIGKVWFEGWFGGTKHFSCPVHVESLQ